jgi:protein-S-isoprenylcysteine O-methyltransferase Ste14
MLSDLERRDRVRLSHLTKVTNGAVLFVLVVLGFVAIVGFVDADGKWFALTWLVLCLIAAVALIRWAWARNPRD